MQASYEKPTGPAWARPPIADAVATAMGWKHPTTGELLVSVKGLLNNTAEPVAEEASADNLPKIRGTKVTAIITDESGTIGNMDRDFWLPPVAGDAVTPVLADKVPPVADEAAVPVPPASPADSGATADGEKIFAIKAGKTTSMVELLAPNHHAYTKWEVNGEPIVKRGNTCEVPNGAAFTARNAKGEYTGNA